MENPTEVVLRRVGAYVVDYVFVGAAAAAVATALGGTLGVLVAFAIGFVVFAAIPGATGTSPGKGLARLRLVNREGEAPGILKATIRWLLLPVDTFPGLPLIGGVAILRTQTNQRVGDLAADTYVVDQRAAGEPLQAVPGQVRPLLGELGLILVLLALPFYYGIKDLGDEGDLSRLGDNLKDGLSNGAIWALVALGYTLVYGIIELINFAHGEVFMIGSFVSFGLMFTTISLTVNTGAVGLIFGLLATVVVAMLACGALNVMIERVGYRPLRGAPKLAPLITAVGFSFILQNVGLLWLGGAFRSLPQDLIKSQESFGPLESVAGVPITNGDVLAVAATIPLVLLLTAFVSRSRIGKAMRATAQDPEAARLMGINVDTTISFTFLLGGMLAGAAGLIYALYQTTIWFFQGFTAGLIAFTAAVMGGIGNLQGAVLGGLIIGCIQQISDNRIGSQWTPAIVFGYLVLIMVFRPQGLLGEETREAG
jgi:branched-chain amino acid transport system permease protein